MQLQTACPASCTAVNLFAGAVVRSYARTVSVALLPGRISMNPVLIAPGIVFLGGGFYNLSGQRVCGAIRGRGGRCRRVLSKSGRCASHGERGRAESTAVVTTLTPSNALASPVSHAFEPAEQDQGRGRSGEEPDACAGISVVEQRYCLFPDANTLPQGGQAEILGFPPQERFCDSAPPECNSRGVSFGTIGRPFVLPSSFWDSPQLGQPVSERPDAPVSTDVCLHSAPWPRVSRVIEPSPAQESQEILSDGEASIPRSQTGSRTSVTLDSPRKVRSILRRHNLMTKTARTIWTETEARRLEIGIRLLGFGHWKQISETYVPTKTPAQLQSRARVWRREMETLERASRIGGKEGSLRRLTWGLEIPSYEHRAVAMDPRHDWPTRSCLAEARKDEGAGPEPATFQDDLNGLLDYKAKLCASALQVSLQRFDDVFPK